MRKYPTSRSKIGSILKIAVVAEIVAFSASYFVWRQLNSSRPYRKQMRNTFPSILGLYYTLGETMDSSNNIRKLDSLYWETEDKQ